MIMSGVKKKCLECPICQGLFDEEELSVHVNLHFDDDDRSFKTCDYPGCNAKIDASQMNDHMLAHQMCASSDREPDNTMNDSALAQLVREDGETCSSTNDKLNDSLLARFIQEEDNNSAGPSTSTSNQADEVLARKLQAENNKKLEAESFKKLQEKHGMSGKKEGYVKQFEKEMNRKVGDQFTIAEYYEMKSQVQSSMMSGYDSGNTRTQKIISHLKSKLSCDIPTQFLSFDTDHFSVDLGDKGWGCGYRNIQMLFSSLLKDSIYQKHLSQFDDVPSVPKLQMLIEMAWKAGFDTDGCNQLGGSLQGSKKWIGTTEAFALFSWLRLRTKIIDFHRPTSSDGLHPELFKWIHNYFDTKIKKQESAFPLYLQHQGHSRLCIGYEKGKDGTEKVLLFDPAIGKTRMQALFKKIDPKLIKKTYKQMKYQQFQLLFIDGILQETETETKLSKVVRSVRIPP